MNERILIIDDEPWVHDVVRAYLERDGFIVYGAETGSDGLDLALTKRPDVVLLDLMLPDLSGEEICGRLRERSDVAILMLTAKSGELERVAGLGLGADDYITKPFRHRELLARVRAHLRRGRRPDGPGLRSSGLEIVPERREAFLEGRRLDLTPREFQLLQYFMEHARKALSRERILEAVWGYDYDGEARVVNVTIQRLRDKLEAEPGQPQRIVTVRGVGYMFEG